MKQNGASVPYQPTLFNDYVAGHCLRIQPLLRLSFWSTHAMHQRLLFFLFGLLIFNACTSEAPPPPSSSPAQINLQVGDAATIQYDTTGTPLWVASDSLTFQRLMRAYNTRDAALLDSLRASEAIWVPLAGLPVTVQAIYQPGVVFEVEQGNRQGETAWTTYEFVRAESAPDG